MKKPLTVIALSCSPSKKRNSDAMLDAFIEGMKKTSGNQLEIKKVYLANIPMNPYTYENRLGPEPHEEAFKILTDATQEASGLVIATPTYNFSVPTGLKNFIDRIRFFALDFEKTNKLGQPTGQLKKLKLFFLVSGGTPTWAQKILFFAFPPFWLRGVFLYYGAHSAGAYYSGDVQTFQNEKRLKICRNLGKRYARRLIQRSPNSICDRFFWRPPQKT
jgi:FMN-dependent NADH-azoreductase